MTNLERFYKFIIPEPMCGCWPWTGFINYKGRNIVIESDIGERNRFITAELARGLAENAQPIGTLTELTKASFFGCVKSIASQGKREFFFTMNPTESMSQFAEFAESLGYKCEVSAIYLGVLIKF